MYYILYTDRNNQRGWELISTEDAMQMRVYQLMDLFDCEAEDILVFPAEAELGHTAPIPAERLWGKGGEVE